MKDSAMPFLCGEWRELGIIGESKFGLEITRIHFTTCVAIVPVITNAVITNDDIILF